MHLRKWPKDAKWLFWSFKRMHSHFKAFTMWLEQTLKAVKYTYTHTHTCTSSHTCKHAYRHTQINSNPKDPHILSWRNIHSEQFIDESRFAVSYTSQNRGKQQFNSNMTSKVLIQYTGIQVYCVQCNYIYWLSFPVFTFLSIVH